MFPQKDDSLKSCPKCGQHYRVGEDSCPHCKASLDSSNIMPPENKPAIHKLGRVMYGPSRVDMLPEDSSDVEKPASENIRDEDSKQGKQEFSDSEDDWNSMRAMYGPAPYIPGNEVVHRPWITYFFWVAIVLLISLLAWFLLK